MSPDYGGSMDFKERVKQYLGEVENNSKQEFSLDKIYNKVFAYAKNNPMDFKVDVSYNKNLNFLANKIPDIKFLSKNNPSIYKEIMKKIFRMLIAEGIIKNINYEERYYSGK